MFTKALIAVLAILMLGGCATGKKRSEASESVCDQKSLAASEDKSAMEDYELDEAVSYVDVPEIPKKAPVQINVRLTAKQIQRALQDADYYQGAIDGKIGPKTKAAIISFQKDHNLKPDGIVGKKTTAELIKYSYK